MHGVWHLAPVTGESRTACLKTNLASAVAGMSRRLSHGRSVSAFVLLLVAAAQGGRKPTGSMVYDRARNVSATSRKWYEAIRYDDRNYRAMSYLGEPV